MPTRAFRRFAPLFALAAIACGTPAANPDVIAPLDAASDTVTDALHAHDALADTLDAAADAVVTDVPLDVPADAGPPALRLVGRIDRSAPEGPQFEWSGSRVIAQFTGTGVTAHLHDTGNNEYHVAIDGNELPTLVLSASVTDYPLATGLTAGTHTLELWRRTEAFGGPTQVLPFTFTDGALLPPPAAPARQIEVIGDSISCGYGDEGTSSACHFTFPTENHYLSYDALASRALGADLVAVAWSGYGMYRGYDGNTASTIPSLYDRALPTDTNSHWDFANWQPDAVVINLGTNDWAQGDPGQPYTDAYVAFVQRLRTHYPHAYILASIGPTHAPGPRIMAALATLRAGGDTHLGYLEYTVPDNQFGCDYHPNLVAQQAMADQLTAALRTALGW